LSWYLVEENPLQPFAIHCPSCQRRLIVKNQQLLGKQLPCPNCNFSLTVPDSPAIANPPTKSDPSATATGQSTRQGVDPNDQQEQRIVRPNKTGKPNIDSQMLTKVTEPEDIFESDLDEIDQLLKDQATTEHSPGEDGDDSLIREASLLQDAKSQTEPGVVNWEQGSEEKAIPDESWTSPKSTEKRSMLVIALIGGGGLVLAAITFVAFVVFSRESEPSVDNNVVAQDVESDQNANLSDGEVDDDKPNVAAQKGSDPMSAPAAASNKQSEPANAQSLAEALASGLRDPINNGSTDNSETESDTSNEPSKDSPVERRDSDNIAASTTDGIPKAGSDEPSGGETDATNSNPGIGSITELEDAVAANADAAGKSSNFQSMFAEIFDPSSIDQIADAGTAAEDAAPLPPILDIGETVHPPAIAFRPADEILGQTLPSMAPTDLKLSEAVHLLSSLLDAGIVVDLFALQAAGISTELEITLALDGQAAGAAIATALAPHDLVLVTEAEGQLVIRPTPAILNTAIPRTQDISDLFVNAATSEQWSDFLARAFDIQSSMFQVDGGQLIFTPDANPLVRWQILQALDRLRSLSQLPIKLQDRPDPLPNWNFDRMKKSLEKTGQRVVVLDEPITSLLTSVAANAGVTIWFDWNNLLPHGMSPTTSGVSLLKNRTLSQVAEIYLDRYSLTMLAIDNQNIILSTPAAHRTQSTMVVVPCESDDDAKQLRSEMVEFAPVDTQSQSRLWAGKAPGHEVAFIRVCFPLVSQLTDIPDFVQ
jgi:hypothetical protein